MFSFFSLALAFATAAVVFDAGFESLEESSDPLTSLAGFEIAADGNDKLFAANGAVCAKTNMSNIWLTPSPLPDSSLLSAGRFFANLTLTTGFEFDLRLGEFAMRLDAFGLRWIARDVDCPVLCPAQRGGVLTERQRFNYEPRLAPILVDAFWTSKFTNSGPRVLALDVAVQQGSENWTYVGQDIQLNGTTPRWGILIRWWNNVCLRSFRLKNDTAPWEIDATTASATETTATTTVESTTTQTETTDTTTESTTTETTTIETTTIETSVETTASALTLPPGVLSPSNASAAGATTQSPTSGAPLATTTPMSSSSAVPLAVGLSVAALVAIGVLVGVLLVLRRRRQRQRPVDAPSSSSTSSSRHSQYGSSSSVLATLS